MIYIGNEYLHTIAKDKKTLFVEGLEDHDKLTNLMVDYGLDHIHLGIKNSFIVEHVLDWDTLNQWDKVIEELKKWNYWITLEYDLRHLTAILEYSWDEYNKFVGVINIDIPYIEQLNYHSTIVLNNYNEEEKSNIGIWNHSLHELKNKQNFIDWTQLDKIEEVLYIET